MKVDPKLEIIFVRESPSKLVGSEVPLGAFSASVDAVRVGGGPNQKQIAISNPASALSNNVYVYDRIGGPIIQVIFPSTSWTLLTSAPVFLKSANAEFSVYVARTIYTDDL